MLGLAAVLVVANGVVAMVQSRGAAEGNPDFSSYRGGRQGTRAVFNTLRRLGMDVRRHEAPLTELPADCAQLWLMNPTQPIAHNEMDALQSWVHSGGQLVVGYSGFLPFASAYSTWLQAPEASPFPELLEARPAMDLTAAAVTTAITPEKGSYAFPLTQEGVLQNVRLLFAPLNGTMELAPAYVPLARGEAGTVLAGRLFGDGVILAIADLDIVSNAGCTEADNIVLACNIAGMAEGAVYFDEYHHGFSVGPMGPVGLIQRSRALGVLGAIAIGVLFVLVAVGSRFGRPEEPYVPPRRSQLEYVDSVAQLYRSAAARQVALGGLYQGAIRRLSGAVRASGDPDHAQLARLAAGRVGMTARDIEEALDEARDLLDRGCDDDITLLRAAARLARVSQPSKPTPGERPR